MLVLGIETATDVCAVGLVEGEQDLVDFALLRPRGHGARLAGLIHAALEAVGAEPSDLDVVAVSAGPGSYTGLRIGVSTAKGLCLSTGAALISVPTLAALASATGERESLVMPVLPSRRGEVYAAAYAPDGSEHRAPTAIALEDLENWRPDTPDLYFTGPAAASVLGAVTPPIRIVQTRPSGLAVARMGRQRAERGETEDVAAFEPAYLKPFVSGGA